LFADDNAALHSRHCFFSQLQEQLDQLAKNKAHWERVLLKQKRKSMFVGPGHGSQPRLVAVVAEAVDEAAEEKKEAKKAPPETVEEEDLESLKGAIPEAGSRVKTRTQTGRSKSQDAVSAAKTGGRTHRIATGGALRRHLERKGKDGKTRQITLGSMAHKMNKVVKGE
jgi:hypothetical protein